MSGNDDASKSFYEQEKRGLDYYKTDATISAYWLELAFNNEKASLGERGSVANLLAIITDGEKARKYAEFAIQHAPTEREREQARRVKALKIAKEREGRGCYIATCVYGSYDCPEVLTLRRFRDNTLAKKRLGRQFIRIYYFISPKLVKMFGNAKWFVAVSRLFVHKLVEKLR